MCTYNCTGRTYPTAHRKRSVHTLTPACERLTTPEHHNKPTT